MSNLLVRLCDDDGKILWETIFMLDEVRAMQETTPFPIAIGEDSHGTGRLFYGVGVFPMVFAIRNMKREEGHHA